MLWHIQWRKCGIEFMVGEVNGQRSNNRIKPIKRYSSIGWGELTLGFDKTGRFGAHHSKQSVWSTYAIKTKKECIIYPSVPSRGQVLQEKTSYYFGRWALKTYKRIMRAHCQGWTF